MQAVGSDLDSRTDLSHAQDSRTLEWNGSHQGVQFGAEKSFGGWQIGVTGGYGTAELGFGRDENSEFDVLNAGLYAGYAADGWFGGAMLRADLIDVESNWASIDLEDGGNGSAIGFELEGGYRADLGGLWVEPALRLAWVNVSLPDQESVNGAISWEDGSAFTGEAGLRLGAKPGWLGLPVRPFLAMSVAREFGAGDETVFDLRTEEVVVTAEDGRTWGRFGGGLAFTAGPLDLYTEVDARFGDIEGVSGLVGARWRF
jgi:outer membrane autotransporter protein